jgi:hypothetical protein
MLIIETIADIAPDGTLTAQAPAFVPHGKRRVVIVLEDATLPGASAAADAVRKLPDLTEFRARWGGRPYPGNSVVDQREQERS